MQKIICDLQLFVYIILSCRWIESKISLSVWSEVQCFSKHPLPMH